MIKNRKKISILIASIIFGIININTSLAVTGTITTETIRIRESATTESKVLDIASLNEKVEILGEENGWYKVNYKGTTGYIYKQYLKSDENNSSSQSTTGGEYTVEPPSSDINSQTTVEPPSSDTNTQTKTEEQTNTQNNTEEPTNEETNTQENKEEKIGTTVNKQTNLYLTPNFSSIKISQIEEGTNIEIINTIGKWSKIKTNKEEGWIPTTVLMAETTNTSEEQQPEEQQKPEETEQTTTQPEKTENRINKTGYISSNASANLRSEPSTSAESLGKLARHTVITVVSEENDWYKVNYEGKEGYISKTLVTIGEVPEETSSRSSELPRTQAISSNQNIVSIAQNYLGNKYVSGGTTPETGFDCSGFTQYVYGQCGITLSRTASSQANNGVPVEKTDLQPGDLLLFSYYGENSIGHVGIYTGNGQFIHSANPKRGVVYDTIESGYYAQNYIGARRF